MLKERRLTEIICTVHPRPSNSRGSGPRITAYACHGLEPKYPGAYADEIPSMIVVGAAGPNDQFAQAYSNYGRTKVHIIAPGGSGNAGEEAILSTWAAKSTDMSHISRAMGGYRFENGTSMAAPFVSGAAALVWSHPDWKKLVPDLGAKESVAIKSLLLAHAREVPQLKDKCSRGRVLDLNFMEKLSPKQKPPPPPVTPPTPEPPPQPPVVVEAQPQESPRYPDIARSLFAKGYSHFWRRDIADAATYFRASIFKDPTHPGPYYYLAFCYGCQGEDERATNCLMLALECESYFPFPLDNEPYYRGFDTLNHWGLLMENVQGRKRFNLQRVRDMYQSTTPYDYTKHSWDLWRSDLESNNWPYAMSRRTGP